MLRGCLDARSITDRNRSFSDHRWGITELHLWAVHEGLRGAPAATLFEDFCRRLAAAGVPLWRAFVGMRTLHPQWAGYHLHLVARSGLGTASAARARRRI